MELSELDVILWYSLRGLILFSLYLFTYYWTSPLPWGKFYGTRTLPWSNFDDSKLDPGMSFALFNILMELPTLLYTFVLFPYGQHATNPKAWLLMAPYVIHYLHRGIIYSILTGRKHIQKIYVWWIVPAMWVTFTIASTTTREISHYKEYDTDYWFWLRVSVGLVLFVWGLWIRVWADHILTSLKGNDGKYKVQYGGWFELVSCPNYLGELMEWLGWFIMTGCMSTLWVLVYSSSLVVPRAYCTHKWYLNKFKDYPKTRKALIPYLF